MKLSQNVEWKAYAMTIMEQIVAKTSGSYIRDNEYSISWHYENVNKEYAHIQKKELIRCLQELVEKMQDTELYFGNKYIEIRPRYFNKVNLRKRYNLGLDGLTCNVNCLWGTGKNRFLRLHWRKKSKRSRNHRLCREHIWKGFVHDECK